MNHSSNMPQRRWPTPAQADQCTYVHVLFQPRSALASHSGFEENPSVICDFVSIFMFLIGACETELSDDESSESKQASAEVQICPDAHTDRTLQTTFTTYAKKTLSPN
ncbi:hypothetical protein BIW11_04902 [Tropilaelaps mercedesae]|uniref:Uncharacterized protein n=1 Tax=Tropilaelaps mercedesae TaxID=418985 RepID=A0A1V9X0A7_9ACAR|nr:hypothetical protein BIW11_04902 [Tropilaelaps mercedesae]